MFSKSNILKIWEKFCSTYLLLSVCWNISCAMCPQTRFLTKFQPLIFRPKLACGDATKLYVTHSFSERLPSIFKRRCQLIARGSIGIKNDDAPHCCFWLFKILDEGVFLSPPPPPQSMERKRTETEGRWLGTGTGTKTRIYVDRDILWSR